MSEQSKQTVKEIEQTFRRLNQEVDDVSRRADKLGDKQLSTKIQKVKENSFEVVKHIIERTGSNS